MRPSSSMVNNFESGLNLPQSNNPYEPKVTGNPFSYGFNQRSKLSQKYSKRHQGQVSGVPNQNQEGMTQNSINGSQRGESTEENNNVFLKYLISNFFNLINCKKAMSSHISSEKNGNLIFVSEIDENLFNRTAKICVDLMLKFYNEADERIKHEKYSTIATSMVISLEMIAKAAGTEYKSDRKKLTKISLYPKKIYESLNEYLYSKDILNYYAKRIGMTK
ncbi:hypothetical protein AYI68_g2984 [Smittium mucronatum]|uniref:Uncharacterized protein n=1 Tax=Smittium mucronatum TaxID=133383 RepID=A0A1R0H158_9FUNG|nr:hypothetical protein AYI68_g2984 [Smittium mucronatum]